MTQSLTYHSYQQNPNIKPKYVIILLHGYGANGQNLLPLAHEYKNIIPNSIFIAPNAPTKNIVNPSGFQWFCLQNWEEEYLLKGINNAIPILDNFIQSKLNELEIEQSNLILIGFSQGTMLALHYAFSKTQAPKAVIGFSGGMITSKLESKIKSKSNKICLIHGKNDEVVPPEYSLKTQTEIFPFVKNVECHLIDNLSHSINNVAIQHSKNFLLNQIKPDSPSNSA